MLVACTVKDTPRPTATAFTTETASSRYLYLWTASSDSTHPDFLAVFDVQIADSSYGRLVATVPVPGRQNGPHHTEHQLAPDNQLFANGFASGRSVVFDLSNPLAPRVVQTFGEVGALMHPHSFLRMPGGNVLATFQMQHDSLGTAPGGLAEMTPDGRVVRTVSANQPGVDRRIRPYSAAIVSSLDRILTTTTDMVGEAPVRAVQVWRLSDLQLLHTFDLPNGPHGDEGAFTAEPRVMADGRTVLVSTFNCGLYVIEGLDGNTPSGRLVSSFPQKTDAYCAIPVISGHYYLVTVPAYNAVVSLDIADPLHPREVSRVVLGADDIPHWISIEPNQRRVVITGYGALKNRVVIAAFDSSNGSLNIDQRFREAGATEPGIRMDNRTWPHGGNAAGIPHGAVFSRP